MKELVIGCDNAALELKQSIMKVLDEKSIKYTDMGVFDVGDNTMYPVIAEKVIKEIIASEYQKEGILLCGTGIGMAIAANKFKGIYAAVCHDIFSAERARLSNDTNVITMGARVIGSELAKRIIQEWLSLKFVPCASSEKVDKIKEYESNNYK